MSARSRVKLSMPARALTASGEPRYMQIAEDLRTKLRSGSYPVGATLPTEIELSAEYQVSRYTVREALRILETLGLVARRQGSGTTVIAAAPEERFVQEISDLEHMLQYPADSRLEIHGCRTVVVDEGLARRLGLKVGEEWVRLTCLRRIGPAGAPICATMVYVRPEYAAVADEIPGTGTPVYKLVERRFDLSVSAVDVDLHASAVSAEIAALAQIEKGAPALTIVRHYYDQRGRTFEVSETHHPTPRFTYRLSMRRAARNRME